MTCLRKPASPPTTLPAPHRPSWGCRGASQGTLGTPYLFTTTSKSSHIHKETAHGEVPVLTSPFTMPAAFDYLDAVWQLRFGQPLLVPPGLERSARLILDVATAEEADTALSALAEVLKNLNVPGVGCAGMHTPAPTPRPVPGNEAARRGHACGVPGSHDPGRRPPGADQFSTCWGTTPGGEGVPDLGLTYPVADWPSAWRQIQAAVAHSCDRLRQELHSTLST